MGSCTSLTTSLAIKLLDASPITTPILPTVHCHNHGVPTSFLTKTTQNLNGEGKKGEN